MSDKTIDFPGSLRALRENWPVLLGLCLLDEAVSIPTSSIAWTILSALIGVFIPAVMLGFVYLRVSSSRKGTLISAKAAFRQIARNWGKFLWALLATVAFVALGIFLFILPVIYFLAKIAFAVPLAVSENPDWRAMPVQGSDLLTRGRMIPLCALQFLFVILSLILATAEGAWDTVLSWPRVLAALPFSVITSMIWICLIAVACDNAVANDRRSSTLASSLL